MKTIASFLALALTLPFLAACPIDPPKPKDPIAFNAPAAELTTRA